MFRRLGRAAPEPTATNDSREIAIEEATAPLSRDRSSLISQPGATYFRTIARIGAQTADALAYAHSQGIFHRDIKPSNLLLDACGIVWIADFGLAKAESADGEGLTHTGDVVGTLRYMAPERFNGVADARSDVYALGTTLYEMLTLQPAFAESDRLKLIERISGGTVSRPRSIDPRIPGDLETIVLKAMAREARERYISARALADDLERFLADRTILARRSSARERAWRWCRRQPVVAALVGLAAILTFVIASVSTTAAPASFRQLDRISKAGHQAQLTLGKALLSEATALERTALIGQRFESLDRLGLAARILAAEPDGRKYLTEVRDRAILALGLVDLRPLLRRQHSNFHGASVDASLERSAMIHLSGIVTVRRLDDDRELVRLPAPDQPRFSRAATMFSPNGELLVASYYELKGGNSLLQVWHLGRQELIGSFQFQGGCAFSSDGRSLLFGAPDGGIDVWDRDQRRVTRRIPLAIRASLFKLDPTNRRLAIANDDELSPRMLVIDMETGRTVVDWTSEIAASSIAWSSDGRLLATGGRPADPRIYVREIDGGRLVSVLEGHFDRIIDMNFAHTRYLLASASSDGTTRLWDAVSGDTLVAASGLRCSFPRTISGWRSKLTASKSW